MINARVSRFQAYSYLFIFLLGFVFLVAGCKGDKQKEEGPDLTGYWEVERVLRNGRPTESAQGLFFRFGPEDALETNVSSSPEKGTYARKENVISTTGISLLDTYNIISLEEETLVLRAAASNYRFEFLLRRAADQSSKTDT